MKNVYRTPLKYDPQRLLSDLAVAEAMTRYHPHFVPEHNEGGEWKAISLVSRGGSLDANATMDDGRYRARVSASDPDRAHAFKKTAILEHCPYFNEVVDSIKCEKRRVRLWRLDPGGKILKHFDPGESWAAGRARLHLPIVTHDDVDFFVAGERVAMKPGELWYCDFSKTHWGENRSSVPRVHLVLDIYVSDWLRQHFPSESLAERSSNWLYYARVRAQWKLATMTSSLQRKFGRAKAA